MDISYKLNTLDFSIAFQPGQILNTHLGEISFTQEQIGELVLTSGKLVACDPFYPYSKPFTVSLPQGSYPVILSIARIPKNNDRRVAYAMLCLSDNVPIRWEMATLPSQNLSTLLRLSETNPVKWEIVNSSDRDINLLEEGQLFGYGVDSGTGCFMDANIAQILEESINTEQDEAEFIDRLDAALGMNCTTTWAWANMRVSETAANVIAFSSGWGDGVYATYFGYDIENNIVNVVTYFAL